MNPSRSSQPAADVSRVSTPPADWLQLQPQSGTACAIDRPQRRLSASQVRAIFDAMRTFRDDDLSRSGGEATFECDRCGRRRPSAGSLVYGDLRLCNGCATDYELLRTAGLVSDIVEGGGRQ